MKKRISHIGMKMKVNPEGQFKDYGHTYTVVRTSEYGTIFQNDSFPNDPRYYSKFSNSELAVRIENKDYIIIK